MNKDQWIKASNPPFENGRYIACVGRTAMEAFFKNGIWKSVETLDIFTPIGWMNLPEPMTPPDPFEVFVIANLSPTISCWIRIGNHDCRIELAKAIWDAAIESTKAKS